MYPNAKKTCFTIVFELICEQAKKKDSPHAKQLCLQGLDALDFRHFSCILEYHSIFIGSKNQVLYFLTQLFLRRVRV